MWLRKPALAAAMALLLTIGSLLYTGRGHEELSQVQPPGTPVGDLQVLDRNHDIFNNFDLLDDLAPDEGHRANP